MREEPSQVPPQSEPSVAHAARPPRGSPIAGAHTPTLPVTLQASHCPAHGASQQTPSTQLPVAHWFAPPQAVPSESLGTHTPAEHQSPKMQSASFVQLPLQDVAPHT